MTARRPGPRSGRPARPTPSQPARPGTRRPTATSSAKPRSTATSSAKPKPRSTTTSPAKPKPRSTPRPRPKPAAAVRSGAEERGDAMTRRRLYLVGAFLGVLALLPLVKLVGVQFRDASELARKGVEQRRDTEVIPAQRGAILDRNGVELAISVPRSRMAVNRMLLADAGVDDEPSLREFGTHLAGLLGVDAAGVVNALVASEPSSRWVEVADMVDPDRAAAAQETLTQEDKAGVLMSDDVTERVHPAGESGLRVIGTLGRDGPGPGAGVEKEYDDVLHGRPGKRVVERGTDGETITGADRVVTEPRPGSDVQVTLDRTLQYETERILAKGASNARAKGGIAVLGRPATGELLAVAGVERDEDTGELKLASTPLAFTDAFQAGSVFKLVTVAAAYEAGVVDQSSTFQVPSSIQVYDRKFSDHEAHGTQQMSVDQIVADSSNVGTITIGQKVGAQRLHDELEDFGFGRTTGVGHPAESSGILPEEQAWTPPDLAAASIGTFQSTTVLQLWAAYNVIANDGRYVPPRLVDATVDPLGTRTAVPAAPTRQVISPASAGQVEEALLAVVREGTGKQWDLPGFPVAAKTGTGRMPSPEKVVKDDDYIWPDGMYHHVTTFAGYLPADRPQVSITVMLLDTAQGLTGSSSAGPVFSDLARLSIRELSIAPTATESVSGTDATATPTTEAPVRSAPATAGSGATERPVVPAGAGAPTGTGGSTRSGSTSTTIAPAKGSSRASPGTG